MKLPDYSIAEAWARERVRALLKNPTDRDALCLLALLQHIRQLEGKNDVNEGYIEGEAEAR
jgi:hypothetical protein